jgi:hypothetical protein
MSEQKMVTEREARLRERKASAKARCAALRASERFPHTHHFGHDAGAPCGDCMQKARERYPLPTVTRPRVFMDSDGDQYRVVDGTLQTRRNGSDEWVIGRIAIIAEDRHEIDDLFAHPTETVEDCE